MAQVNPYDDLRALLDTTRELSAEEMAELQLEQGYPRRALAIYERLALEEPRCPHLRARRDWLRRVTAEPEDPALEHASVDGTLRGVVSPAAAARSVDSVRPLRIVATGE